jgi:two-component system response regulator DctR
MRYNPAAQPLVTIVDDDSAFGESLVMLMKSASIESRHLRTANMWMAGLRSEGHDPRSWRPGCVMLDVRMNGISGLQAFDYLIQQGRQSVLPVIFITGHGDLDMAVDVLRRGAFDFLSKPFVSEILLQKVRAALDKSSLELKRWVFRREIMDRISTLTPKEHAVMLGIISGKANREIAAEFGNSVRTVELHRAVLFDKMQASSAVELTALISRADLAEEALRQSAREKAAR